MTEANRATDQCAAWRWLYLRHKHVPFSSWRLDDPPGLWVRLVCRVFLGWKLETM